jgi:hypothetical protein
MPITFVMKGSSYLCSNITGGVENAGPLHVNYLSQLIVSLKNTCTTILLALTTNQTTIEEITENSQTELRAIPKKAYQDCFQKWPRRWERCINAGGEYFEGDKADSVAGTFEKIIKNS